MSAASPASGQVKPARTRRFILGNLSIGHAINHWYVQGLVNILLEIQDSLHLSNVQLRALRTIQQASSGVANVPTGFVIDMA